MTLTSEQDSVFRTEEYSSVQTRRPSPGGSRCLDLCRLQGLSEERE